MKPISLCWVVAAAMLAMGGCQSSPPAPPPGVSITSENMLPDIVRRSFLAQHPRALIKQVNVLSTNGKIREYRIIYLNPKGETEREDFSPSGFGVKDSGNFPEQ